MQDNENEFIVITVNQNKNRVEASIRGVFPDANQVAGALMTLDELSSQYDTILLNVNSPGGDVATLADIVGVLDRFNTVITVACGMVASAGFLLWAAGDVRVIKNYTSVMAHRESYNYNGKTTQHIDLSSHWDDLGNRLLNEFLGGILTGEEIEKAKYTEVFLTDVDMIERGVAITWHQFLECDATEPQTTTVFHVGDKDFILLNDGFVQDNETGYVYKLCHVLYNTISFETDECEKSDEFEVELEEVVANSNARKSKSKKN